MKIKVVYAMEGLEVTICDITASVLCVVRQ